MQEQINVLWDRCLSQLSKRVKKNSFFTWLKPTQAEFVDGQTFNILVPNSFAANWIDERYRQVISEALTEVADQSWNFGFKVRKVPIQAEFFLSEGEEEVDFTARIAKPSSGTGSKLNPRYRFENFVVGDSNQFAYAACQAVAVKDGGT